MYRLDVDLAAWYELLEELCFKILNPPEDRSNSWSMIGSDTDDDITSSESEGSSSEQDEWQDAPETGQE